MKLIKAKNGTELYVKEANKEDDFEYVCFDSQKRFLTNIYKKLTIKRLKQAKNDLEIIINILFFDFLIFIE